MTDFNWRCPYCDAYQTVTSEKRSTGTINFRVGNNVHSFFGLLAFAIGCSNPECKEVQVQVSIAPEKQSNTDLELSKTFYSKRLLPDSSAKPQPAYIPRALRDDYSEACKIRELSPKAAATLARRCLQGMIRDFCGITKGRLIDEINELTRIIHEAA